MTVKHKYTLRGDNRVKKTKKTKKRKNIEIDSKNNNEIVIKKQKTTNQDKKIRIIDPKNFQKQYSNRLERVMRIFLNPSRLNIKSCKVINKTSKLISTGLQTKQRSDLDISQLNTRELSAAFFKIDKKSKKIKKNRRKKGVLKNTMKFHNTFVATTTRSHFYDKFNFRVYGASTYAKEAGYLQKICKQHKITSEKLSELLLTIFETNSTVHIKNKKLAQKLHNLALLWFHIEPFRHVDENRQVLNYGNIFLNNYLSMKLAKEKNGINLTKELINKDAKYGIVTGKKIAKTSDKVLNEKSFQINDKYMQLNFPKEYRAANKQDKIIIPSSVYLREQLEPIACNMSPGKKDNYSSYYTPEKRNKKRNKKLKDNDFSGMKPERLIF